MRSSHDDNEQFQSGWNRKAQEARDDAEAVQERMDRWMFRTDPYNVPEWVDLYNREIQRYASYIRPKRHELGGNLWTETVATVLIPEDGSTVDGGRANAFGEIDTDAALSDVPRNPVEVSLADLREWSHKYVTVDVEYIGPDGHENDTITKMLYLPGHALDRCKDQLDDCLDDLGWLPDVVEQDYEEEGDPL